MAYAEAKSVKVAHSVSASLDDFDPAIKRAADYAERLQVVCDRLRGPEPSAVADNITDAPPGTIISSINRRRSHLVDILNRMERALVGIEEAL